ncbi:MAG: hypothetical protein ABI919_14400, partial [Ramlibacter sp.]
IHDYLRLLFARAGTPYCPDHDIPLSAQTVSQMVDAVLALPEDTRIMILAPLAREKKGEFVDVFAEMQAKGYVRFRVDGKAYEFDDLPRLKKTEKHDIDVVIDRLKVRADVQQRLAESFEAALRLADGRAIALETESGAEHLFNAKFACPVCNYSISELEPRLFSFNSPVGACPSCDGLGHMEFFDPARVVAFPTLSLGSGAIKGWDRRNGYYFALIESLAKHYKFSVDVPFEELELPVQNAVLHGSGEEEIKFSYTMDSGNFAGKKLARKHAFEGIIPNMARRYRETDSVAVREELARYRSVQPCPDCGGTRLRSEARHVKIGEGEQARAIYEVSHATLRESFEYFSKIELHGAKAEIAGKVIREIGLRLKFLNDVGLNYLSLDRSAETLSGGEAQRIRLASQIGSGLTGVMYVLDEPSIGLHQRDNDRLISTLRHLRDIGNSVIVVEHDEDMIRAADHVIDMGPGAGIHGGRVMAQGTFDEVKATPASLTGQYLSGAKSIPVPVHRTAWMPVLEQNDPAPMKASRFAPSPAAERRAAREAAHRATRGALQEIRILGASGNNLKDVSVAFPVGVGLALVIGTVESYVETPKGDPGLLFTGVALIVFAMIMSALAHKRLPRSGMRNPLRGVVYSAIAGCLMGFFYPQLMRAISPNFNSAPIVPGMLTPYAGLVFFAAGVLGSNVVWNTVFMRTGHLGYADYFRGSARLHAIGILGGAIWMLALSFNVIASSVAGPAVSYALGQGATLVAAIWGLFIWREFR